ncbi:MAG TPA: PP2C family serine/threonine-protein phosphatase [Nitrospiraceae bacterium]|nr:PP2C family serine/threonine-protein phosphatase [Nitrospiraceae bacterium]
MLPWYGIGASHQGLVRSTNQDAFLVDNHARLWAVADGMGGHPGGDVASRLVIDTLAEIAAREGSLLDGSADETVASLRDMAESAHRAILNHARLRPELLGMGTTLTGLHISPQSCPTATIINEGDSRAYLWRHGILKQLTRDHSMVEEYVRQGLLSPEQALRHPQRHVLSRAVGLGSEADVDITTEPLEPDDILLLCTDGLTKMIDDERLATALSDYSSTPEALTRALVSAALEAGGHDNVTVVVVYAQSQTRGGKIH